jgi:multicomponent Na+:H+ antiporter subunit C
VGTAQIFALAGIGLFVLALHAVIVYPHLLRKIMAVNVMGSGVFLMIGALARRASGDVPDPVPHALVITGIVVSVAATALAITLMLRVHAVTGRSTLAPPERD